MKSLLHITLALTTTALVVYGARGDGRGGMNVCRKREIGERMCPELFVLGVQKGGSSALWVWVMSKYYNDIHTGVATEDWRRKEIHFFDVRYENGVDWYASNFPIRNATNDVAMDGTPDYSRFWMSAERLYETLPVQRLRFIVSFRDPIARSYSWYRHVIEDFLVEGHSYQQAYQPFNYSYSNMASYAPQHIDKCIRSRKDARHVHRECAFTNSYYWGHHGVIPETKQKTNQFQAVAMLFTDGLYGFILLHWFQYFHPDQFCLVFYDYLIKNFQSEIKYLEPCLQAFGRGLPNDLGTQMPEANRKTCENSPSCDKMERLSKEQLHVIGKRLHTFLYRRSNELFRSLVMTYYGRMDPVSWEEPYLQ